MKKMILVAGSILIYSCMLFLNKKDNNIILVKDNINTNNTIAMYKSDDNTNYTAITEMPESGYTINEEKSYCTLDNKIHDTTAKLKTIDGNHTISGLKKSSKCYIWFDKLSAIEQLIVTLNAKDSATTFSGVSTTDEGVFKVADGMYGGMSYYWRGAATTNHVIFANKCWRIVRINGDKTIRLIFNGAPSGTAPNQTCPGNGSNAASIAKTNQKYNESINQSNYVGWTYTGTSQRTTSGTPSNAKTQTESWFNDNNNFTDAQRLQVADGKFCNDRDAQSGSSWAINGSAFDYATYKRTITDRQPTLSCPSGDVYTLKVGAITADEVLFAGGWNANNTSYYLYNGQNYWTMSPNSWYNSNAWMFYVNYDGYLGGWSANSTWGVRPVINLKSDATFNEGGLGTSAKPYVVQ